MLTDEEKLEHIVLVEVEAKDMAAKNRTILVRAYAIGQFRIQITDISQGTGILGAPPGHGDIVQEMCTYKSHTMVRAVAELMSVKDPVKLARSWAKPHNCEFPGGRIRMDNEPAVEFRPIEE